MEVGRIELYDKQQAAYAEKREMLLNELAVLEQSWNKLLKMIAIEKTLPERTVRKVHATIVAKGHELAELDAESSKLANLTDQNMNMPVCVRGKAYGGSVIVINSIKYMLTSEISRVIFKLKNKHVTIVTL